MPSKLLSKVSLDVAARLLVVAVALSTLSQGAGAGTIDADRTGGKVSGKSAGAASSTLVFPRDVSMGVLYRVRLNKDSLPATEQHYFAEARGTVKVPFSTRVHLRLSYSGAEALCARAAIQGDSLVALDARNLENFNDRCLENMSSLKNIIELILDTTDVTDEGLKQVSGFPHMFDLCADQTLITSNGLKHLSGLVELYRLAISHTRLTDASLAQLVRLQNLRILQLGSSGIGDQGLLYVGKLKNLNQLDLSKSKRITSAGIAHLTGLSNLFQLDLTETSVNIDCLPSLKRMPKLTHLELPLDNFSIADVGRLARELPRCQIAGRHKPKVPAEFFQPLH